MRIVWVQTGYILYSEDQMVKSKRGAQSGKKGGSFIDDELNNPTARKNNKNKNQKGKKPSRGK